MNFPPSEVDAMTFWEFASAWSGYKQAHMSEEDAPPPMSDAQAAELGIEGFS